MRILLTILLIAVVGYFLGMFLPWWSIAIAAFAVSFVFIRHLGSAFLSGFAGIFLLWIVVALWIDTRNQGILSSKVAQIIPLGGSGLLLVLVTALLGGLVGGCAAVAGSSLLPYRRKR
ncbi:MAG TPA: hypothetical protein VFZ78_12635 [Flavisolibacter sp.]